MKSSFLTMARIAGILYLLVAVCGGTAQVLRTGFIESGDAAATAQNILDSEFLFRFSFSIDLVTFCSEIALALVFYLLFRPVNQGLALLAAFFRMAQAIAVGINLLNQAAVVLLLSGESYLSAFTQDQLDALSLLFLEMHNYGYLIGLVFFGLSSFFLGYLVYKSGAFPKVFGLGLMVFVAFGYVLDTYTTFLIEDKPGIISIVLIAPATIAELSFILWLLVKGGEVPETAGERA